MQVVMFIPEWQALKDKEPDVELEAYCQAFLQKLSLFLKNSAEDSACMECIYLGEGIFCNFVDMSELHRDSLMKQRLTAVATACFRCCREEEYRFGIPSPINLTTKFKLNYYYFLYDTPLAQSLEHHETLWQICSDFHIQLDSRFQLWLPASASIRLQLV